MRGKKAKLARKFAGAIFGDPKLKKHNTEVWAKRTQFWRRRSKTGRYPASPSPWRMVYNRCKRLTLKLTK